MHNNHNTHGESFLKKQVEELKSQLEESEKAKVELTAELEKSEKANIVLYKAFIAASEEIEANLSYQNIKGFRNETEINLRDAKYIAEEADTKVLKVNEEIKELHIQNNELYNSSQLYKQEAIKKKEELALQIKQLRTASVTSNVNDIEKLVLREQKIAGLEKTIQTLKVFLTACKKYDGQTLNGTSLAATAKEILSKVE